MDKLPRWIAVHHRVIIRVRIPVQPVHGRVLAQEASRPWRVIPRPQIIRIGLIIPVLPSVAERIFADRGVSRRDFYPEPVILITVQYLAAIIVKLHHVTVGVFHIVLICVIRAAESCLARKPSIPLSTVMELSRYIKLRLTHLFLLRHSNINHNTKLKAILSVFFHLRKLIPPGNIAISLIDLADGTKRKHSNAPHYMKNAPRI